MAEKEKSASEIGKNNLIWVERTNEWMHTAEATKVTSGSEDTATGEKRERTQIFVRLTDGHELVFDSEDQVRVRE